MNRLRYIFWLSPLFFLVGCGQESVRLAYRPEFLHAETATPRPAGMVFDPPALAHTNAFGRSEIAGINLNTRTEVLSTAGTVEEGHTTWYRLYYYDRQDSRHGRYGNRFRRVFRSYTDGAWSGN